MPNTKSDPEAQLGEAIEELAKATRAKLSSFEDDMEVARDFIRKNPLVSVLGALALGFLASRMFRKSRVVYLEKPE